MIIPILRKKPGKVVAGRGLQSISAGGKTLLSVMDSRANFRGAFYSSLVVGDVKGGLAKVRVGEGLVNGLVPFLGKYKLDDPKVEPLDVKQFSGEGYAWVLVRVKTDENGRMTAAGKGGDEEAKYGKEDLQIVAGTRPRRIVPEGDGWIAEHAVAVLRQPKGGAGGIEIRQIVFFDLQHYASQREGRVRHFFGV
jgi:hypothetical protein